MTPKEAEPSGPTYSVSFRLRRTTTESGFVSVPVTADLLVSRPNGTKGIDVEKMTQRATEMGQSPDVKWRLEEQGVELHPTQTAPPGPD